MFGNNNENNATALPFCTHHHDHRRAVKAELGNEMPGGAAKRLLPSWKQKFLRLKHCEFVILRAWDLNDSWNGAPRALHSFAAACDDDKFINFNRQGRPPSSNLSRWNFLQMARFVHTEPRPNLELIGVGPVPGILQQRISAANSHGI